MQHEKSDGAVPQPLRGKRLSATVDPVLTVLLFLFSLSLLLFLSGRGLDLADESYYVLAMQWRDYDMPSTSGFGRVLGPLYDLMGQDLVRFRRFGIIVLAIAGFLFGQSANRYFESHWQRRVGGLEILMATGALMYYSWLPTTPSYNWLNLLGMLVVTTALLHTSATAMLFDSPGCVRSTYPILAAAAGTALTLLSKPTSGMLMLCVSVLWLASLRRSRVASVLIYCFGTVGLLLVFAEAFWGGFGRYLSEMQAGLSLARIDGTEAHSAQALPRVAAKSILSTIKRVTRLACLDRVILSSVLCFFAGATLLLRNRLRSRTELVCLLQRWAVLVMALLWLMLLLRGHVKGGFPRVGHTAFFLATLFGPSLFLFVRLAFEQDRKTLVSLRGVQWLHLMTLWSLPALFWLGSTNNLETMVLPSSVFWILGGMIIVLVTAPDETLPEIAAVYKYCYLLIVLLVLCTMLTRLYVLDPTKKEYSALRMQHPVRLANGGVVRLEDSLASYADSLCEIGSMAGLRPGDSLINLTGINCGVNLIWGTRPLGIPWVLGFQEKLAIAVWAAQKREVRERAWVLTTVPNEKRDLGWLKPLSVSVLAEIGLRFPDCYEQVGSVFNPVTHSTETLWRPKVLREAGMQ